MPAKSKAQQRYFGYLLSNKDEREKEGVSRKVAREFAGTKHKGLPEKVKEGIDEGVVKALRKGLERDKKARKKKRESEGRAVPYGMLAQEYIPEDAPTMSTGSTGEAAGLSGEADAQGPVAGLDQPLGGTQKQPRGKGCKKGRRYCTKKSKDGVNFVDSRVKGVKEENIEEVFRTAKRGKKRRWTMGPQEKLKDVNKSAEKKSIQSVGGFRGAHGANRKSKSGQKPAAIEYRRKSPADAARTTDHKSVKKIGTFVSLKKKVSEGRQPDDAASSGNPRYLPFKVRCDSPTCPGCMEFIYYGKSPADVKIELRKIYRPEKLNHLTITRVYPPDVLKFYWQKRQQAM